MEGNTRHEFVTINGLCVNLIMYNNMSTKCFRVNYIFFLVMLEEIYYIDPTQTSN